jgi:nuclear pore complex protein Nup93
MMSSKEGDIQGSLTQLLEKSRQLAHPMLIGQELPVIERGVESIEMLTRKLAEKSSKPISATSDSSGKSTKVYDPSKLGGLVMYKEKCNDEILNFFLYRYRLLASKGLDTGKLNNTLNNLDVEHTFELFEAIQDTDIESYLRHKHEMAVVAVIEEARSNVK